VVTSYSFGSRPSWTTRAPTAWTFEGSNDASNWTVLDTRSGITGWVGGDIRGFSFSNANAYLYYRLNVSATGGGSPINLMELRLATTSHNLLEARGGSMSLTSDTVGTQRDLWMVVHTHASSSNSFTRLGTSGNLSHFPFTDGNVYIDAFLPTRRSFTPTMGLVGVTRLLRISMSSAGVWTAYVDGVQQNTASGQTFSLSTTPQLVGGWAMQIAEALILDAPADATTTADLIGYFNAEHGLTVPGASQGPGSYIDAVLADGPVMFWGLDEASGTTAYDLSGQGRNGTHTNSPSLGQASLLADGSGHSTSYVPNQYTTIAGNNGYAWQNGPYGGGVARIKPSSGSLSGDQFIASSWSGNSTNERWLFYIHSGKLTISVYPVGGSQTILSGTTSLVAGTQYTVGWSWDGTTLCLYLNGALEASMALSGHMPSQGITTWSIDVARAAGAAYGTIQVQGFGLFDFAPSATRMLAYHNSAIGASSPSSAVAVLTAASTLTATAVDTTTAADALAATSSLGVTGTATRLGADTLSATALLTAAAVDAVQASNALSAASVLAVSAGVTELASVALSANSALLGYGTIGQLSSNALVSLSSLTVSSVTSRAGSVALSSVSALSATPIFFLVIPGSASLVASSTLTSAAALIESAAALLSSTSVMAAQGDDIKLAMVSTSALSILSAEAHRGVFAALSMDATSMMVLSATFSHLAVSLVTGALRTASASGPLYRQGVTGGLRTVSAEGELR
jgi:hypothetical protein